MKNEDLQELIHGLPLNESCLIIKNSRPEDLNWVRAMIMRLRLKVIRETESIQPNGLRALAVVMPPQNLDELVLELVAYGFGGEFIVYGATAEPARESADVPEAKRREIL